MSRRLTGVLLAVLLLLVACEPEATPLPVNPVVSPEAPPTEAANAEAPPLRYAIAPDALAFLPAADRDLIAAHAEIVTLAADDDPTAYEIAVALSALPDATAAPEPLRVGLVIDTTLAPLDDPALAAIIRAAVDAPAIAQAFGLSAETVASTSTPDRPALRRDLANLGYPDGFDVTLYADSPPLASALASVLNGVNVQARITTDASEAAPLSITTTPADGAIPLLALPIYYRAADGLTVTFTPSGFPIGN